MVALAVSGCAKGKDLPPVEKLALFKSVEAGDTAELRAALNAGVTPNLHHSERGYLIHEATVFGNQKALKMLIDAGANVNAKDREGEGSLIVAILGARCEEAKMLLQAGANPNEVFSAPVAAEAAAPLDYHDKTARELYLFLAKQTTPDRRQEKVECWLKVENLLGSLESTRLPA